LGIGDRSCIEHAVWDGVEAVRRSRFQKHDGSAGDFRESSGEDSAGRAAANDEDVGMLR
jgi:hypothetical protein